MIKKNVEELALEDSKSHPGVLKKKSLLKENENQSNIIINEAYLKPKAKVESHEHLDIEETFYVLEGNGKIKVGNEEQDMKKGDIVSIPIKQSHEIENTGENELRFIVIQTKPLEKA